jgi:hypothetical protein
VRNRKYREFIGALPCLVCGTWRNVDAAHTGPHGISTKASDLTCLPLCHFKHHPEFDAAPRDFALVYGLNIAELIEFHNHLWNLEQERRKAR